MTRQITSTIACDYCHAQMPDPTEGKAGIEHVYLRMEHIAPGAPTFPATNLGGEFCCLEHAVEHVNVALRAATQTYRENCDQLAKEDADAALVEHQRVIVQAAARVRPAPTVAGQVINQP